jgi:hypothetical protein
MNTSPGEQMMTWQELKKFISKMDKSYLDSQVKLYDYSDGSEYNIDITELLINEGIDGEDEGWVPYLSINHEEVKNETKTEETSID